MTRTCLSKVIRKFAPAAIAGTAMLVASPGTALASYGPPLPPPGVPGGYFCILASQVAGAESQAIEGFGAGGLLAQLEVGLGTFLAQVQITLTEPYGQNGSCQGTPDIGDAGFPGFAAFAGVGVFLQRADAGVPYHGKVHKPLTLRLTSKTITRSSVIVVRDGNRFVKVPHAVVRRGFAIVKVTANSDFAVLNPVKKQHGHATTSALYMAAGSPLAGPAVLALARPNAPGAPGA